METAKLRLALLLGGGLETFLGGMETPVPRRRPPEPPALKPSLVEWKHLFPKKRAAQ